MKPQAEDRRESAVDERLRRGLEPDAETVARLVRSALHSSPEVPRWTSGPALRRWAPVALLLALVAAAIPILSPVAPPPETPPPAPRPPVLRISNEDGLVTVTMPAGSKMVILPGDAS